MALWVEIAVLIGSILFVGGFLFLYLIMVPSEKDQYFGRNRKQG